MLVDDNETKIKCEKVLRNLSGILYLLALISIGATILFPTTIYLGWIVIPLALFAVCTYVRSYIMEKSWKSFGAICGAAYFSLSLVLGILRPDLGGSLQKVIGSITSNLFLISLLIVFVFIIYKKYKRRIDS